MTIGEYRLGINIHKLKISPEYFEEVFKRNKTFEIRKNDREFKTGDKVVLCEYKNGKHTGRSVEREIGYILENFHALDKEYIIFSLLIIQIY